MPAALQMIELMRVAWRLVVRGSAAAQIAVGIGLWVNGPPPAAPFWSASRFLPWWVWAAVAIAGGTIVLVGRASWWRIRLAGLISMAVWYCAWATIIILGVAEVGFPYYAIGVYTFLAVLHILIPYVEYRVGRLLDVARAAA